MEITQDTPAENSAPQTNPVTTVVEEDGSYTYLRNGKKVRRDSAEYARLDADRLAAEWAAEKAKMEAMMTKLRAEADAAQKAVEQQVKRVRQPLNVSIYKETRSRAKAFADATEMTIWQLVDTALNSYLDSHEQGEQQELL